MKKDVIRIAHVIDVMDNGGIEAVVMNYYRNIDRNKVQFDFIVSSKSSIPQRKEIEQMGGRIYVTPRCYNYFKYKKELTKIFIQGDYKIVHSHMGVLSIFPLRVAKLCGIKNRICHAHSTSNKNELIRTIIKQILKPFAKVYSNYYFACGNYAGEWLFGKKAMSAGKVSVINNAIDLEKFKFDKDARKNARNELKIPDDVIAIGHVGRFAKQKNHDFLINVFNDFHKLNNKSVLVLIGEGELEQKTKNKVNELGLDNAIKFLGPRNDVYKLYNAFDIFLLPSLYEGLPVVGVEAQASGLPCVFSNKMTKEIKLLENTKLLDISSSSEWASELEKNNVDIDRSNGYNAMKNSIFSIQNQAKELEKKYFKMLR